MYIYLFIYSDKPAIPLSSDEVKALKMYVFMCVDAYCAYVHIICLCSHTSYCISQNYDGGKIFAKLSQVAITKLLTSTYVEL